MMNLARRIRIERMDRPFTCGFVEDAVGCWTAHDHLLRYDKSDKIYGVKGILEHEFLHALFYKLGDARHWCSLHDADKNQVWDCYE